jgi:transposase
MSLRERGWSIRGAAREIGISRTTANNWSRGYKVYRRGQLVGFVPPLERLAVRQISPRFLSQDERIELADLRHAGLSIRQIACRLGRAPSTISRELRRNATTTGGLPPVRRPPPRDRTTSPPSLATSRSHSSARTDGGRAFVPAMESAADQPPPAPKLSRAAGHVVVSREHLSGRLPAGISVAASDTVGSTPTIPAADGPRPPPRPAACRTTPAPVPAADAHHP